MGLEGRRVKGSLGLFGPAFLAGALLWLVPLVMVSGGPAAYRHALFDQGAEDLGNIQMLWTRHGTRDVLDALYYAFVAPWAVWPIAAVGLTCAVVGVIRVAMRQPQRLCCCSRWRSFRTWFSIFCSRKRSRAVTRCRSCPPMAYLAVCGLRAVPWDAGLGGGCGAGDVLCAHRRDVDSGCTRARRRRHSGCSTRCVRRAQVDGIAPVLAMDRRESLDLRRPIAWLGAAMPAIDRLLPAPPQHEWLEAVKYWNGGGRAPVWFVVDPRRTQHRPRAARRPGAVTDGRCPIRCCSAVLGRTKWIGIGSVGLSGTSARAGP